MNNQYIVRVAFLDVGHGDTIVVSIPETREAVIIDCVDQVPVFDYLQAQDIQHIRGLIITHLHVDHYKGVVKFLKNCKRKIGSECEKLFFNWYRADSKDIPPDDDGHSEGNSNYKASQKQRISSLQELKKWTIHPDNEDICYPLLQNSTSLLLNSVIGQVLEIVQPNHGQLGTLQDLGPNNTSAIIKVHGAGSTALLTADIEPEGWHYVQTNHSDIHSDVLKFPHHGGWKSKQAYANPEDILDSVHPSIVVLSVGTESSKYDLPNKTVLQALAQRSHIRTLCTQATDKCGANLSQRSAIIETLQHQATHTATEPILAQHGCPCAGTIVIDLGQHAKILQPDTHFHQEKIIKTYYPQHQCVI